MDKIKNYCIIILAIAIPILIALHMLFPKVVTKVEVRTVVKTEVKTVIKYLTLSSVITGGTVATINANGSTSVSGANLTITSTTTITLMATTVITVKEKDTIKETPWRMKLK